MAGWRPAPARLPPPPETTIGRWWFYLAASLFAGVLAAWKLVLGPVLDEGAAAELRLAVRRPAYHLVIVGGLLLVMGTLYAAVAQAAAAADVSLVGGLGQPLADLLLRGRFASIWWPRIGLEVVSLLLIGLGGLDGLASECVLATLPAVLLTSSLTSHAAALSSLSGAGIAVDWLHIVGAAGWLGGLIGLLTSLPLVWRADRARSASGSTPPADDRPASVSVCSGASAPTESTATLPRVLARFARFAVVVSGLVVLSGVVQAALEVGSWADMVSTLYGQLVLVKVGLVLAMLALAGLNEWRGRSMAADGEVQGSLRGLRHGIRVEVALGVVVLAVAAVLSGTPPTPARASLPALPPLGAQPDHR